VKDSGFLGAFEQSECCIHVRLMVQLQGGDVRSQTVVSGVFEIGAGDFGQLGDLAQPLRDKRLVRQLWACVVGHGARL